MCSKISPKYSTCSISSDWLESLYEAKNMTVSFYALHDFLQIPTAQNLQDGSASRKLNYQYWIFVHVITVKINILEVWVFHPKG